MFAPLTALVFQSAQGGDEVVATRPWKVSKELTGVQFLD
jgi:hypothetical protein